MFKKINSLFLCIVVMISFTGCSQSKDSEDTRHYSDAHYKFINDMKSHLYLKYGDIYSMKIISVSAGSYNAVYDEMYFSSEINGIEENFSIKRYEDEEGVYSYEDNYFGVIIRDSFENKVGEYAQKYFTNFKVYSYLKGADYPDYLTVSHGLEDLLKESENLGYGMDFNVIVEGLSEEEFSKNSQLFYEDWSSYGLNSIFGVYLLPKESFDSIDRTTDNQLIYDSALLGYDYTANR